MAALSAAHADYLEYVTRRHRPAHARRRADQWAAFLLPHLRPEMRILDLGCGPGSITTGLGGRVVGLDIAPLPVQGVPVVGGEGSALPFAAASFDAIHLNAVLQHVDDAAAVLREARRVAAPGAVIGVGDADWGSRIMHPHDPLIVRGQEIQEAVREAGNVRVGRELRGLLATAGFERAELGAECRAVGSQVAAGQMAAFEASWFVAPEAVAHVTELGVSDVDEMATIASAWERWAADPGACATSIWFTAVAWAPSPAD